MASSIWLNACLQIKNQELQKADIKSQGLVSTLMTPEVTGSSTGLCGRTFLLTKKSPKCCQQLVWLFQSLTAEQNCNALLL